MLIAGFLMFGLPVSKQVTVRYIGTYLATGAYVSNWAALNAYQANNIVGQWKRATTAAAITACNGLGGIAGSFIVRAQEAPEYQTAVWVSIGYIPRWRPTCQFSSTDANIRTNSSHILMIVIIGLFTIHFYMSNQKQSQGRMMIEGKVSLNKAAQQSQ